MCTGWPAHSHLVGTGSLQKGALLSSANSEKCFVGPDRVNRQKKMVRSVDHGNAVIRLLMGLGRDLKKCNNTAHQIKGGKA